MTLNRTEPPSTWMLAVIAVFLLVLNLGMICLLTAPPVVLDLAMGGAIFAIGVGLSLAIRPWRWLGHKE